MEKYRELSQDGSTRPRDGNSNNADKWGAGNHHARGRSPRGGSSFLARFGQIIVQHGIAAIPSALFYYQGKLELTAQEVWFISAVLARKWTEDLPHPNLSMMERQTGVPERRLRRYKERLCKAGYLEVFLRFDENGRQDSSYYDFGSLFGQLESLIAADLPQPNNIRADCDEDIDERGAAASKPAELELPDTSFVARFGSTIVSRGVAAIPQGLFAYQRALELTPQQVWFVSYIFSVPWSPPYPYPSLLKMAARTGYSRMQLHEIKNSLVDRGYLRLVRRTKSDGGQDTNGYDFAELFDAIRRQLHPESHTEQVKADGYDSQTALTASESTHRARRQGRAAAQKRASNVRSNQAVTRLTGEAATELTREAVTQHIEVEDNRLTGEAVTELTGEAANELTGIVKQPSATRRSSGLPGRRAQSRPEIEPSLIEKGRDDSNHKSKKDGPKDSNQISRPQYSPYISAIISDFSNELGDYDHTISNVSQALRIMEMFELEEQHFVELLYETKQFVRAYQGKQGLGTINNKMSYFFVVLRDLIRKRNLDSKSKKVLSAEC